MSLNSDHTDGHYRLVISNQMESFKKMQAWLEQVGQRASLDADSLYTLRLCLTEALSNIISYAYDDDTAHDIEIHIYSSGDKLDVEIIDDGHSFNPLEVAPAVQAESLEDAQIGGFGIHLIRQFVDKMSYERRNNNNYLSLSMRCSP